MAENNELAVVLRLVADQFKTELRATQGAIGAFNDFLKDWKTQLAAAGTALFAVAKSTTDFGDQLFKTSQKVGIQVEVLAGLQHAASLADVSNDQLQTGLQALSRAMVDSAQGAGAGFEAFQRVGISATDANGKLRPMHDVLLDLADVFSGAQDGAGKTELSMSLLGKAGAGLVPLLNAGKAGIQEMEAEARKLGLTMSESDAKAAEAFNDAITKLQAQARGFSNTIGVHMLGPLTELLSLMNDLGSGPIAEGLKSFMTAVNQQTVLFGTMVKEVTANIDFLRGKINFDELSAKIKSIEAAGEKKLFLLAHPGASALLDPVAKESGGRQVELGVSKPGGNQAAKPLVDKEQAGLGQWILKVEQIRQQAEDEQRRIEGLEQEGLGRQIVQVEQLRQQGAAARQQELQAEQEGLGRWIVKVEQIRQQAEAEQRRIEGLEQEGLGRMIVAQTQQQLKASKTFFDGWTSGLEKYVQSADFAFGMAAQMAQRTAQFMEQNFQQFFFDVMDNKIKSLKDLFASFANFAKQMIAQVLAQLATMMALKAATAVFSGGLGGLFGGFGGGIGGGANAGGLFGGLKFASGGPVLGAGNSDTVRALLTPGEGVLNRQGMQALAQLNTGSVPGFAAQQPVAIHFHGVVADQQPKVNVRRQFEGMVIDVFLKNRAELGFGY